MRKKTFIKNNGDMYFEIHHIETLSETKNDKIDNLSKICSNCHCEAHFRTSERKKAIKDILKKTTNEILNRKI